MQLNEHINPTCKVLSLVVSHVASHTQYLYFSPSLIFTDTFLKSEGPECLSPCVQTSQLFLSNQSHSFSTTEALLLAIKSCTVPHPANHVLWPGCHSKGPKLVTPSGHPVGITKPVKAVWGRGFRYINPCAAVASRRFTHWPLYMAWHSLYTSKDLSYSIDMLNFIKPMYWG